MEIKINRKKYMGFTNLILALTVFIGLVSQSNLEVYAIECNKDTLVYGENEIIDQLMICSLSKSHDLDLTPRGEFLKSTSRALVEQGLSNKTSILYAKLNGLWSGRRTKFIDSGWKCQKDKITLTSVIEFTGLSLELIERLELPLHNNQHKLKLYKPCKTFDLPTWMCRSSRPIYRTTTTWVNTVYLNVTLAQSASASKPNIEKISILFTCPETFKQKVTHSPSAMYILSKYNQESLGQRKKRSDSGEGSKIKRSIIMENRKQDSQSMSNPSYQNSVNLILNHLSKSLGSSLNNCINLLDLNLMLVSEYNSFKTGKLNQYYNEQVSPSVETINKANDLKCSDKLYVSQRIELANEAENFDKDKLRANYSQMKRTQNNKNPDNPHQLLDPYSYYELDSELER